LRCQHRTSRGKTRFNSVLDIHIHGVVHATHCMRLAWSAVQRLTHDRGTAVQLPPAGQVVHLATGTATRIPSSQAHSGTTKTPTAHHHNRCERWRLRCVLLHATLCLPCVVCGGVHVAVCVCVCVCVCVSHDVCKALQTPSRVCAVCMPGAVEMWRVGSAPVWACVAPHMMDT
jgi:hypothetical protein